MDRCLRVVNRILFWAGFAVFSTLMLNILVSIAARYLNIRVANIDWVEETSRFLFIWLSFLGAALATERMAHIRIDFFAQLLRGRARLVLEILVLLAMVGFAAVMTYEGVIVTLRASDRSPVLLLPMSLAYLALPISGVAILLFTLRTLTGLCARLIRGEGLPGAASGTAPAEAE
jgi:TRAP-type C4-dicarboxylate transport system permease small subunit